MPWPSKNPDDYLQPSRWDVQPPRWLARMRGLPVPDPTPFWITLCASFGGLIAGGVLGEACGWDAMLSALLGTYVAQGGVQLGWRIKQRRSQGASAS